MRELAPIAADRVRALVAEAAPLFQVPRREG